MRVLPQMILVIALALALVGSLRAAESTHQNSDSTQFQDSSGNRSFSLLLVDLSAAGFKVRQHLLLSDKVESLTIEKFSYEEHRGLLGSSMWERTDKVEFRLVKLDDQQYIVADITNTTKLKAPLGKAHFVEPDSNTLGPFKVKIGDILQGPIN